jgi:hypothetical protein
MTSAEAANDIDIFDPRYVRDRYPIWDELDGCSVAHTAPSGRSDLPRTYALVMGVAHDFEHFSSSEVTVVPIPGELRRSG